MGINRQEMKMHNKRVSLRLMLWKLEVGKL